MNQKYTIAVLSDIHSNLYALNAVLDDLSKRRIDEIIIAGDHIGDGPQPGAVIDRIRGLDAHTIKGNREEYLLNYLDDHHPEWQHSHQMQAMVWNTKHLEPSHLDWIRSLQGQKSIVCNHTVIRIVHGSPRRINELIHRDDHELIKEALASVDEDILICGHCHQQWTDKVNNTLIINPGSLGVPFMPAGHAPYALLKYDGYQWEVELKRAYYDLDAYIQTFHAFHYIKCGAWVQAIIASLKSGEVITLQFLNHAKAHATQCGWDGQGLIPNKYWNEADRTFPWDEYL